ncbi:unnamed protein product [Symbiodinium necroappetens]|uniref:Gamma-glutamylcyclotransferase AIG2-like domain-containing protein n=1 Tax=Symbiodinium necroappetens TaxID=1628268 RepID=A0A812VNM1_9DINO|nr:unnamed protein product [Symbiodinium necroappetens]
MCRRVHFWIVKRVEIRPAVERVCQDLVHAVFAYGTLRGDFEDTGDHWGIIERTGAAWLRTSVTGFKLFQEDRAFYPFAVQSDEEQDRLHGVAGKITQMLKSTSVAAKNLQRTILIWPAGDVSRKAIETCDRIEGFDPENPNDGLYCLLPILELWGYKFLGKTALNPCSSYAAILSASRSSEGEDEGAALAQASVGRAFVYHQPMGDKADCSKAFPGGDWLESRLKDLESG